MTLDELVSSLNEEISEPLAFFCDRPVFQKLYQARVREIQRSRDSFYMMMLELESQEGSQPENDQLEYLSRVLESELRSSRYFLPDLQKPVCGDDESAAEGRRRYRGAANPHAFP